MRELIAIDAIFRCSYEFFPFWHSASDAPSRIMLRKFSSYLLMNSSSCSLAFLDDSMQPIMETFKSSYILTILARMLSLRSKNLMVAAIGALKKTAFSLSVKASTFGGFWRRTTSGAWTNHLSQHTKWYLGPSLGMNIRLQAAEQAGLKHRTVLESVEACHSVLACILAIIKSRVS